MKYRQLIHWSTVGYSLLAQRRCSYYYALGHPKSGTGWLTRMLSTYLGIPKLVLNRRWLPALSPCVIKMHRFIAARSARDRTLYIARDGRDIAVSYYWEVLRHGGIGQRKAEAWIGRQLTKENIRDNLPKLIDYLQLGRTGSIPYRAHVSKALDEGYTIVRYEDLLDRGEATLSQALARLLNAPVDDERLKQALTDHSFEAETGRPRGVEDPRSYKRKGVSGEWRRFFTKEAAEVFDCHAGDVLVRLAYERDRSWVDSLENYSGKTNLSIGLRGCLRSRSATAVTSDLPVSR